MKIYLDVLLITNGILTLIYIETLGKLTHSPIKPLRLFAAGGLGGLASLIIVFDSKTYIGALLITVLKLFSTAIIPIIAIKHKNAKQILAHIVVYYFICGIFTGIMLAVWEFSDTKLIFIRNYTLYFNISLFQMVFATATAYIIISIYEYLSRGSLNKNVKYRALFTYGSYEINLPAIADTGNKLCDNFTGTPVVIFYCDELYFHFSLDLNKPESLTGFRLIPFNTVNGNGLIPITATAKVTIIDDNGTDKEVKCYAGIIPSGEKSSTAIFNPSLISI